MTGKIINLRARPIVRNTIVALVFLLVVVLLMMWLMGVFHSKVSGMASDTPQSRPIGNARLEPARLIRVPASETAVGSIRAVHETSAASKLLAKVVAVNVKAGQVVRKDDVLVQLDDTQLKARRQQASASTDAARAAYEQAKIEMDRVQQLFKQNAASQIELDRIETAFKSAAAELQRAEQGLKEADTFLSYTSILSPMDGIVVDKKVDAGDTAQPGQVLLTLYDPTRMQLVASVRESLAQRMKVGNNIGVRVDSLSLDCEGQISEIVPESESASRTFSVKVIGPCPPGVYAGMFGRLVIPLDEEEVLVIPQSAVRRVGQLEVVDVADGDGLKRRAVQLGRSLGEQVQVLSGLREGEKVAVNPDK